MRSFAFGNLLKKFRDAAGVTIDDMAYRLETDRRLVEAVERSQCPIPPALFIRWAEMVRCPVPELMVFYFKDQAEKFCEKAGVYDSRVLIWAEYKPEKVNEVQNVVL